MTDEATPPEQSAAPSPASRQVSSAQGSGLFPPRCPQCLYRLDSAAERGACPECGTAYDAESRFAYAVGDSFGRVLWRVGWPIVAGLAFFLTMTLLGGLQANAGFIEVVAAVGIIGLPLACLVNATVYTYRRFRKAEAIRAGDAAGFGFSIPALLKGLGCGVLVTAVMIGSLIALGCGMILLFMY